jgi:FAD/FMN-containing dehydrogenase
MMSTPANADELSQILAAAFARKEKVGAVDLSALNRVVEHKPEDMTVTAQAGITLAALQSELAKHNQWLAVDPPQPERLTLRELTDTNASGPRRFGCGTIRDYLLGIQVALADGTLIRAGGKVVKNVAGYDLGKLFIGAHGSLGVVTELTFKLRPLPELERFVSAQFESETEAERILECVLDSELTPTVLDLHNMGENPTPHVVAYSPLPAPSSRGEGEERLAADAADSSAGSVSGKVLTLVLGFAGSREETEWQVAKAGEFGLAAPGSLEHEAKFWLAQTPVSRVSVLPSKLMAVVRGLGGAPFVARAGNGIVYHRGVTASSDDRLPIKLMRRLKDTFDPRHILPELPMNL